MPHTLIPESLDIKANSVFSQYKIAQKSKGKLSIKGVCNGIVFKYALEHLERNNPQAMLNIEKDILRNFDNFILMTNIYQTFLQTQNYSNSLETEIPDENIKSKRFIESLSENVQKSRILGFGIAYGKGSGHIISIILTKDEMGNNFGFKIFDPNLGEINCNNLATYADNREKFDQQLENICNFYEERNESTIPNSYYTYDLENFLKTSGISKANPFLKDKHLDEHGEQVRVKPILSEYSYDQLNSFLEFHLSRYDKSSLIEKNKINKDIEELIKFGANPNLLKEPHVSKIRSKMIQGDLAVNSLIKAMLSNNPENTQVIKNIVNFIGIDAANRVRYEGGSLPFRAFGAKGIPNSLSIKMIKMGFRFKNEELQHTGVRMINALAHNPNASLNIGENPIIFSLVRSKEINNETLDYLLNDKRVNINLTNTIGNSLLHTAVKHNKVKIVRTLITKGADMNLINNEGKRAIEYTSNPEITNMMLQASKPKFSIFSSTPTSSNSSLSMVIAKRNKSKRPKPKQNKENIHTNSTQTTLNFFQPQTTPIPLTTQYNSSLTSNPKKRKSSDINHS